MVKPLPRIMVAPNGARRTTKDHPNIPVTIPQIVKTAKECFEAGADGIHAHVRDAQQKHILDAGLYSELISELSLAVPSMQVQITTEAVGLYSPNQQRKLVRDVKPSHVSISLAEVFADNDFEANRNLYHWCADTGISVQHILYRPNEVDFLSNLRARNIVPHADLTVLFVLGRYSENQHSEPDDIQLFIEAMENNRLAADWAVCAFGRNETKCLVHASKLGGRMRIGFENNLQNEDGSTAESNSKRILELISAIGS